MKVILKKSTAKEPFTFSFNDGAGGSLVRSENYAAKKSALNGIESVKKNAGSDGRYELKESTNGKFFFNLKAGNGQVVCSSKMFATEADRSSAISQLKAKAASAELEDNCG